MIADEFELCEETLADVQAMLVARNMPEARALSEVRHSLEQVKEHYVLMAKELSSIRYLLALMNVGNTNQFKNMIEEMIKGINKTHELGGIEVPQRYPNGLFPGPEVHIRYPDGSVK